MKVLLLTTYPHGGAGIACRRLQAALHVCGVSASLLTANEVGSKWPFYAERLSFLPYERDKSVRFSFSLANFGHDLTRHPLIQEADVIHLHWINQGFLSLQNIHQLAALDKPVVWTLHDMWAFTGGCHYSAACDHYKTSCGNCPCLRFSGPEDLSKRIWMRKKKLFPENIRIVTCSNWLADVARSSNLLQHFAIQSIPNPIDITVFQPVVDSERRRFRQHLGIKPGSMVLLFVAMKIADQRKGFQFLVEALQVVRKNHPGLVIELLVLGKSEPGELAALPYPVHALGMVTETGKLTQAYAAADVFVIPSLEDNLPNTVMEALACGTPVVGFNTGGIPEMVGHCQEGYIAPQGNSALLAEGVRWVLQHPAPAMEQLRHAARRKVETCYADPVIARQYIALYEQALQESA